MNRITLRISLLLIFLLIGFKSNQLFAQFQQTQSPEESVVFEHLNEMDGLSGNHVVSMLQDHLGLMWFGTQNGLSKYDGYEFTVYRHMPGDSTSLASNWIEALYEDAQHNLWVGTFGGGLHLFDYDTETFKRYQHDSNVSNSLSDDQVTAVYEAPSEPGVLWIGSTYGGLDRLDVASDSFTHFKHNPADSTSLSSNGVRVIYEDSKGVLWVGTGDPWNPENGGGLNVMDRSRGTFTRYMHRPDDRSSLSDNRIRTIYETPGEPRELWVGTWGEGLHRFDRANNTFERRDCESGYTVHICDPVKDYDYSSVGGVGRGISFIHQLSSRPEVLLIGVLYEGIYMFDRNKGTWDHLDYAADQTLGLNSNLVWSIYEDRGGTLWIGTLGRGVNKLNPSPMTFRHYAHDPGDEGSLSNNNVKSLYEDAGGVLWVGTAGGLNRLSRRTQTFTRFQHHASDPTSISNNDILSITSDAAGVLWVGTNGGGLNSLSRSTGRFSRYRNPAGDSLQISPDKVNAVHEDEAGTLWVGTEHGLSSLNRETQTFSGYLANHDAEQRYGSTEIRGLFEDHAGRLWISKMQEGGLLEYRAGLDEFDSYLTSWIGVTSMYEDEAGRHWIGTNSQGLFLFDPSIGNYDRFTRAEGLAANSVYCVVDDNEGYVWLSTANGISRFDPKTGLFKNFDVEDHFVGASFEAGSCARSKTGEVLFGSNIGLFAFSPTIVDASLTPPQIVLTDFRIYNQPVKPGAGSPLEKPITLTDKIQLKHFQNDFTFSFAALDFSDTEHNQYAYALINYDDEWRLLGNKREITFTNLDPGTYIFRVKAANSDGVWNEAGISVEIIIKQSPWFTWWACVLYALLAAGFIFIVDWIRRTNLLKKERERSEADRLKHLAATAVDRNTELRKYQIGLEKMNAELLKREAILKEQAEQLTELDNVKSRFLSFLSHEIRSPLTLILDPIKNMLASVDPVEQAVMHKQLNIVFSNTERLLRISSQLLDLAKMENGKFQLKPAAGDFVHFLQDQVNTYKSLAELRGVELTFHCNQEALWLLFDADAFEKVVYNLVSNAIKFTPEGAQVVVGLEASPAANGRDDLGYQDVEITVKDQGMGMSSEEMALIFDRYYQVEAIHTTIPQGVGLGLSLARELVERQGGTISVKSGHQEGSTFTVNVKLPADTRAIELAPGSLGGQGQ